MTDPSALVGACMANTFLLFSFNMKELCLKPHKTVKHNIYDLKIEFTYSATVSGLNKT